MWLYTELSVVIHRDICGYTQSSLWLYTETYVVIHRALCPYIQSSLLLYTETYLWLYTELSVVIYRALCGYTERHMWLFIHRALCGYILGDICDYAQSSFGLWWCTEISAVIHGSLCSYTTISVVNPTISHCIQSYLLLYTDLSEDAQIYLRLQKELPGVVHRDFRLRKRKHGCCFSAGWFPEFLEAAKITFQTFHEIFDAVLEHYHLGFSSSEKLPLPDVNPKKVSNSSATSSTMS